MNIPEEAQGQVPPTTIWDELEKWATAFAPWQRFILSIAVRNGTLNQSQIDQAYALFLNAYGLSGAPIAEIEIPTTITGRSPSEASTKSRLKRVHGVSGVNALPNSAELTFSPTLTLIYGGNGAGKSGFARILSNVCFSRMQHEIIPNVYDDTTARAASATIEVTDSAGSEIALAFDGATEHPVLKAFAVFDSAVARKHLTDTGPLGFKPAGFDVFLEMARVYAALASRLSADTASRTRENKFNNSFIGMPTAASKAVASLNIASDLAELRKLAVYGDDHVARLEEIQRLSVELQGKSPADGIKRLAEAKPPLVALKVAIAGAREKLSKTHRDSFSELIASFAAAALAVAEIGVATFQNPRVQAIGNPTWETFIAAAAESAADQHDHYPDASDICLLCQQALSPEAVTLMQRYWSFLGSPDRQSLVTINARMDRTVRELGTIKLGIFGDDSLARAYLAVAQPSLSTAVSDVLAQLDSDRNVITAVLAARTGVVPADSSPDPSGPLDAAIAKIDQDIATLKSLSVADALKKLAEERAELRHREVLKKNLADIEHYLADLKWIAVVEEKARPSLNPRHLTAKEQEFFGKVIADNYRTTLADECANLDCTMPIEFRTQGQRGQTVRSLVLKDRSPAEILSEGEQRAVALADFLTEVSLNELNAGIILDDPVNSQDHLRKERFAVRLVEEATKRQVIIFTHDLLFFTKVCAAADDAKLVNLQTHWIQRDASDRPGLVSLDDSPATTPQYRKTTKAASTIEAARPKRGSDQLQLLQRAAGQLRRTIEEVVPHFLLKQVVNRWTDRVMVTSLKNIVWDKGVVAETIAIFEECSAIIEGHSHTESGVEAPPTLQMLDALLSRTNTLIKQLKVEK